MAQGNTAFWPIDAVTGFAGLAARFASHNIKTTVVISVVLICGAFAAASALQMRFDRIHALNQASYFETRRANDIAAVVAGSLDSIEAQGHAFADDPLTRREPAAIRNIAVYDAAGFATTTLTGTTAFLRIPRDILHRARTQKILLSGDGFATIVASHGADVIAVAFDTGALAPKALTENAAIIADSGLPIVGAAISNPSIRTRISGWPALVAIAPNGESALNAWYGSLPLYLFVILGPALVGAGLAVVFVSEFERRGKAMAAVRALRSTKPEDARLLVRLAQAEREAIEARRSKAEFISHMSHELRTPLNAVIGFSELIERGMFGAVGHPKYVEYARDINAAGRALHDKIGDILDFADMEAGRHPLDIRSIDIAAVARDVVAATAGRAVLRRIKLTVALPASAYALGDAAAVKRIVSNLLTNALQYTQDNGAVRIQVRSVNDVVAVTVRDNGLGFSPVEMEKAGNPFLSFDRAGAAVGNGLGLAICNALARRMHGVVQIGSRQGQGTIAELRLPRAN